MSVNSIEPQAQPVAFELKGSSFTLPLLKLLDTNLDVVAKQLVEKVNQAPDFFRNTPVVIDLHQLATDHTSVDFALLVGLLRGYGMIPIGVRGGNQAQNDAAHAMELAILADTKTRPKVSSAAAPEAPKPARVPLERGTRLIKTQVRSGQRLYASGGDLVVIASVSSGAELIADGNIHVYGTLRGRALAGVKGNHECRIFCSELQAELVSVAGHYRVSEDIDETKRGKQVQIFLREQKLIIDEM